MKYCTASNTSVSCDVHLFNHLVFFCYTNCNSHYVLIRSRKYARAENYILHKGSLYFVLLKTAKHVALRNFIFSITRLKQGVLLN
ncbi:hypothetical protein FKM82_013889 [Ascaphus truei]